MEWFRRLHQFQHCTESQKLHPVDESEDDIHILHDHFLISLTIEDYVELRKWTLNQCQIQDHPILNHPYP